MMTKWPNWIWGWFLRLWTFHLRFRISVWKLFYTVNLGYTLSYRFLQWGSGLKREAIVLSFAVEPASRDWFKSILYHLKSIVTFVIDVIMLTMKCSFLIPSVMFDISLYCSVLSVWLHALLSRDINCKHDKYNCFIKWKWDDKLTLFISVYQVTQDITFI